MTNDPNGVKRTLIAVIGVVLFFGVLLSALVVVTLGDGRVEEKRLEACMTIQNETLRRDCIAGPATEYQEAYP